MVRKPKVVPFFSIITCTKNSAKYLSSCLDSVKQQSYPELEHLIVDGESTDLTLTMVKHYHESEHPYTTRIISTPPCGIANAMNKGLSVAKGEYIYFLNSDDSFYSPKVLEQVHDYLLKHPQYDWVFGKIHETDGQHTIGYPPRFPIFHGKHTGLLKYYNYIPHQATFVRKSVFDKYGGFDEALKSMMDPEYWLRLSSSTQWGYMPIIVANYLIRPDSQSENRLHAKQNTLEYESVQQKYLTSSQIFIAKIINKILR